MKTKNKRLAKILTNYSVRSEKKILLLDLDVGLNSVKNQLKKR
jgi:hypothetical protein